MSTQLGFLGYVLVQSLVICAVVLSLFDIVRRVFRLKTFLAYCTTIVVLGLLLLIGPWSRHLHDILAFVFQPDIAFASNVHVPDFFYFVSSLHLFSIALLCAVVALPFM